MQSYRRFIFGLVFSLVLLFGGTLQAAEGVIEEVSFHKEANGSETVLFHLNGPHLPSVFALNGEKPRVVFDFRETSLVSGVPVLIPVEGKMIQKLRLGRHPGKVRAVIDLVPGVKSEFEQSFDEKENVLTIRLVASAPPEVQKVTEETETTTEDVAAPVAEVPTVKESPEVTEVASEEVPEVRETASVETPEVTEAASEEAPEEAREKMVAAREEEPAVADISESEGGETAETSREEVKKTEEKAPPEAESAAVKSGPVSDPLLVSVKFETTPNKGEMVLFKLNGFYPPTVSGEEEGTPRVICDFTGARLAEDVAGEQVIDGAFVEKIRVQKLDEAGMVRVVLDLVPSKNYDLQQVFFKEDNLFVIIVNSYDVMSEPAKEKN